MEYYHVFIAFSASGLLTHHWVQMLPQTVPNGSLQQPCLAKVEPGGSQGPLPGAPDRSLGASRDPPGAHGTEMMFNYGIFEIPIALKVV